MAVEAQYPSNVLFLNRSEQNGKSQIYNNYSSLVVVQPQQQQQPSGVFGEESFLDPTQMLFNQGATTTAAMNPLTSMQSQSQLINLAQLHNSSQQQQQQQQQTNVVSTGLQLAFGNQLQPQQHSVSHQSSHQSSVLFSILTDDFLGSHIKQQQDEMDHFLQIEGEQLRRTLEEKRKMHYHALIGAVEESTTVRKLREKETEVEKASRRNAELAARAAHLTAEARGWQVKASEQEVMAATLQAQLKQAVMNGGGMSYDGGEGEAEDAESVYADEWTGPVCKVCRKRFATMMLLPCRHLCVCKECDGVAQSCPLCRSIRSSRVEVFLC